MVGGEPVLAHLAVGGAEAVQSVGLAGQVAAAVGGLVGVAVHSQSVGVVPASEGAEQGCGQRGGVGGPAGVGGGGGGGDEGGAFGGQPGPGGVRVDQVRGGGGGGRDAGPAVGFGRVQGVHRGRGGGQVEVEQPGQRGAPL